MSLKISIQKQLGDFYLDVAFEAPASGVTAIFGPSGCGKTSLLRAIAGLASIDTGSISFQGEVWDQAENGTGKGKGEGKSKRKGQTRPVHQRGVGYVFQEPSLFSHLSVRANLEYGQKRQSGESEPAAITELAELLGIQHLFDRGVQELSGGEQQRVAIGRALLANPKILLMDEPLASLDAERKRELLPYLDRLHRNLGIPILYVSHALDEIVRLADHLVLMEQGAIIASGPIMEILQDSSLLEVAVDEPFTVLEGKVAVQESQHQLTEIRCKELSIRIPLMKDAEVGQMVRLKLAAKDISLNLEHAKSSSILNILEAEIVALERSANPAQNIVRLRAGEARLSALISQLSCEKLGLEKGLKVFAQIKAASLIQ